ARARALLGHWLYANGRPDDACAAWNAAAALDPDDPVVWRNLGLAAFNHLGDADQACAAYDSALAVAPEDARLIFERDQLDARRGVPPGQRLDRLLRVRALVETRDDATIELAHLLLSAGRLDEARELLLSRTFQPWEGGEGEVLRVWDRLCRLRSTVDEALNPPRSLSEARHPLANTAQLHLLRGDLMEDRASWELAAAQQGDFLGMSAQPHSEATFSSVLALRRLGRTDEAARLAEALRAFCDELEASPATVDYFATSLPSMLLFTEDLAAAQRRRAGFLRAQLDILDWQYGRAGDRLAAVLAEDPHHVDALDLARSIRTSTR
ncbi:tetratricopeptide repeat protein, partial [Allokutzneria sp. NRRL B-24872]|uniref:tetratricopeptide repeat protein n=1 Tax=Allokutzneria sp. NRRL B-24872 TaxID=1137961 RepID=UPI001177B87F